MEAFNRVYKRGKRNNQTLIKRIARDMQAWYEKSELNGLYVKPQVTWIDHDTVRAEAIIEQSRS